MKSIQVAVMLALAGLTASAFAGPNWEVIDHARQASAQAHAASPQAMEADCAQMMKHMSGAMMQPAATTAAANVPGAPASHAASALFGERVHDARATTDVSVSPGVKAIPVSAGDSVRFNFGTTSATWHFAPQSGGEAVDLGLLFPDVPAAQGVWAYPRADRFDAGH